MGQNDLVDNAGPTVTAEAKPEAFAAALGTTPADEFALYAERERAPTQAGIARLQPDAATDRSGNGLACPA